MFARTEQRSLFGEILDWMLAPLLLLWPMSLGLTWIAAQAIANRPYDRDLAEVVRALARQAQIQASRDVGAADDARRVLEATAVALRRADDEDRIYFQVLGRRGELLAGVGELLVPLEGPADGAVVRFRDDQVGDEPVRVAWLWLTEPHQGDDSEALVQVAETLGKRSTLATEIIKGVILPQFVILPLAVVLVWFALSRGIRPLARLQARIRRRESTDLSPIPEGDVPDEVVPLVRSINDLLQRLDRTIATQRHFLADAAHQLKTPLAGLRTQAELAARDIDGGRADAATMKHSLRQIALSSQRAAHMVNQLLAMARAEDAGLDERRRSVDLAAVTRAVVRDFVPRSMERRIDLGYEGPEAGSGSTRLMAEPVLLSEMVRNLVDNALRYTPPGGTVTARIVPDPAGKAVVLEVEDSGPGIPPAEREAVFRPFYRALGTQVDGSGLGLAIVLEVAQRHDAEVTVTDARPRSGATTAMPGALFTVRFPRQAGAPSPGPKPQPQPAPVQP
ncbi:MAG TPA: sensor histidine kinase N-terminal domain-containing protein [Rubrivivax sp.]|nr:sensor histidine kinase N-terminal domain-containing protein [Rubrivivax sp.]